MYAIADMGKKYYYINDDYYIEKCTFDKMLSMGYCMNIKEIIRDFSGWSWKIEVKEIENIQYNLVYQSIRILVGNKFLEEWKNDGKLSVDYIVKLQEKLSHAYGTQNAILFYKAMYLFLAIVATEINEKIKKEFIEEKNKINKEIEIVKNKALYLEKITSDKKEVTKKIKRIDEIINNDELLEEELKVRKQKLGKKSKLLTKQYLKAILSNERRMLIENLEKLTYLMNPKNYASNKIKIQRNCDKINDVLFEMENETYYSSLLKFQKQFLKCIETKVKNTNVKKDILDLVYYIRYYIQLPINKEKIIKEQDEIRMQINTIQDILITKYIN